MNMKGIQHTAPARKTHPDPVHTISLIGILSIVAVVAALEYFLPAL